MSVTPKMGDRRGMKLWSWLTAFHHELLFVDPAIIAASLLPDMVDRVIKLAPRVAQWLLAVAEAAEVIRQTMSTTNEEEDVTAAIKQKSDQQEE